jgi:hypothetical protein
MKIEELTTYYFETKENFEETKEDFGKEFYGGTDEGFGKYDDNAFEGMIGAFEQIEEVKQYYGEKTEKYIVELKKNTHWDGRDPAEEFIPVYGWRTVYSPDSPYEKQKGNKDIYFTDLISETFKSIKNKYF